MIKPCLKRARCLIALGFMFLIVSPDAPAMEGQMARASLRGIHGVSVVMGTISANIEAMGLTAIQIKTDVESKLQLAGISALTPAECLKTAGNPNLFVGVACRNLKNTSWYYYTINIALIQDVYLSRNQAAGKFPGKTWTTAYYGAAMDLNVIRGQVGKHIDKFLEAYHNAN